MRRLAWLVAAALLACGGNLPPPSERPVPSELPAAEREAQRRLPLDGSHNFRDLGGYAGAEGRAVKWGVLYRSDALADLSDDDLAYLERLELRQLVDFRSDMEVERDPDRLVASDRLRVVHRPIQGEALDPQELQDQILSGEADAANMVDLLVDANRAFVVEFDDVYAAFLRDLGDAEKLPMVFHCTAGKDRAGFAAALALLAAGVPRETIMGDYLLTNGYSEDHTRTVLNVLRIVSLFRTHPDSVRPLFEAREPYLQEAFDTIDATWGGTDAYLRQGLGADDALLARVRANLLE